jgi:hypothetical protein
MRLTRAAQRAQEGIDEPTTDATQATESTKRGPLNEISPNASPEQAAPVEEIPKKTPARSKSKKGAKKGAKGKKAKAIEEEQAPAAEEQEQEQERAADDAEVEAGAQEPTVETVNGQQCKRAYCGR